MTSEEAIKILNPDSVWGMIGTEEEALKAEDDACRLACIALEKQIPMKPEKRAETNGRIKWTEFYCSACDTFLGNDLDEDFDIVKPCKFCHECSQAIDWSDECE